MDSKNITKSIVGITIASLLIAALVVPVINSAELGQTYNVPTHGKEQLIANKDFNWWVDYWEKYNCESCWIGLWDDNGVKKFRITDNHASPWQYYTVGYDPNFDMSYDIHGTWIIQFNSTDGIALGDNYLVSTNAPVKEYAREIVYKEDTTTSYVAGWYNVNGLDIGIWTVSEYSFDLHVSEGTEVGNGYYSFSKNDIYDRGNEAELFFKVTDIGKITIGGDPTIRTLLFIIPVLMLAGLVITVALSLNVKRD